MTALFILHHPLFTSILTTGHTCYFLTMVSVLAVMEKGCIWQKTTCIHNSFSARDYKCTAPT